LGYSAVNADLNADGGELDVDGFAASLYGTYYLEQFYVNSVVIFGWRDYQSQQHLNYSITRNPNAPLTATSLQTNFSQTFEGDFNATEFTATIGAGYDFYFNELPLGPYANVNYFPTTIVPSMKN
jgi:outer membrane autotransporter protein